MAAHCKYLLGNETGTTFGYKCSSPYRPKTEVYKGTKCATCPSGNYNERDNDKKAQQDCPHRSK